MENLTSFYVIWRGDEDEFFITKLDLDPLMMAPGSYRLTNLQIIQLCWDTEYPNISEYGPNPFVGDSPASYEMIDIISGENINFHME